MDRIAVNPRILGGKPVIKGTRISVDFILELLASDVSEEEARIRLRRSDVEA